MEKNIVHVGGFPFNLNGKMLKNVTEIEHLYELDLFKALNEEEKEAAEDTLFGLILSNRAQMN